MVQQFDALCQQAYQEIQSAPLRLGISVALVPDYLPNLGEVLEAFRQQYPGIPLEHTSLSNDEVPVQLQNGTLDAGLVMDLGGCATGLARTALSQHTTAVMVSRSSPFWERIHISPAELDGQTLLVPGFAPDALAPLWQALQESGAHPQLELGKQFYQVLYRTQEQNCVSLNRFEETSHSQMTNVRNVILDGLPPICAGFLRPKKQHNACAELLCRFLQERLKF